MYKLTPALLAMIFALTTLAPTGCHKSADGGGTASGGSAAAAANVKVYKLRGKVLRTDAASGELTVNHEAIAGFMEAMTMPYKLKDPAVLAQLHPGDLITADVLVRPEADADLLLDRIVVIGQAKPPAPEPSTAAPNAGPVAHPHAK